jgi:hypothetical protein
MVPYDCLLNGEMADLLTTYANRKAKQEKAEAEKYRRRMKAMLQ